MPLEAYSKKRKKRKLKVSEARGVLINEEASKLIDMDEVTQDAINRAEQTGIIFIDEIDKIASNNPVFFCGCFTGRCST